MTIKSRKPSKLRLLMKLVNIPAEFRETRIAAEVENIGGERVCDDVKSVELEEITYRESEWLG
jgi:hypothetical protein